MKSKENSIQKILSQINFKMSKKLGEGRFSIVKLATHSLTNQEVAIKILDKTKISNLQDKERINREIKIMKKINHFNITKLYTIIETKYIIYLVQEYVQGKELNDYLYSKGKLPEPEACQFFHQIISGLSYLHHLGIAHRDFKPENILLTNDNKILKIIDFGLGNLYKKGQLLKTGCGSPCYIPPEMIKEEKYNAEKSDIWSTGIILYLMLCGHLPFYEEDNQLMYDKIIKGEYDIPKFLSNDAKDIIKKILEVDPKKRINFDEIKKHPWFNIIDKNYMMFRGIDTEEDIIPLDEDIIEQMEKIGINKIETRFHVLKNYHNKITTIYDILLKKKIDSGKKSISDMQSDLFNEYINDKKNKISFYGNLEEALKHRIFNNNQIVSRLPNWPENRYENDNENMIKGDNGSVMERLIKAGKFVYDEEKMCLNKVTNINNRVFKNKNNSENEVDYKYKTISSINTNNHRKMKKIIYPNQFPEEKKKSKFNQKAHYKYTNQNEIYKENNMLNLKKIKTENKKSKLEDEDWFKEVEKLIDENYSNSNTKKKFSNSNKSNNSNNNNYKQIRVAKTSKFYNNKKDEIKVSSFYLDKENKEFKQYQNQILSPITNKISNVQLKQLQKKKVNVNKINNFKNQINFHQSAKIIQKEVHKLNELKGKNRKKQKSMDKNIKNKNDKIKNFGDYNIGNFEVKERRRNQSFQKRYKKIKI